MSGEGGASPRAAHSMSTQSALGSDVSLSGMLRCLYGGAPRSAQVAELMCGPHIVVATPGRLIDFAEGGELDLTKVCALHLSQFFSFTETYHHPDV